MNNNIFTKLLVSCTVLAWALLNLSPLKEQPYREFLVDQNTYDQIAFGKILEEADKRVEEKQSKTLFLALRDLGEEKAYDYAPFFPELNVRDVRQQNKRNNIILRRLLMDAQSALKYGLDLNGGVAFTLKLDESNIDQKSDFVREEQLKKVVEIMSQRLNGLGVSEPTIRIRGDDAVEVLLPGKSTRQNPELLSTLQKPARLEFRLVHRSLSPRNMSVDKFPVSYEVLINEQEDFKTGATTEEPLFVKRLPEATGDIIESAYATQTDTGGFQVIMDFTSEGGNQFKKITSGIVEENSNGSAGRLAIVLDGKLYSAPSVQVVISRSGRITGTFTQREAMELANVLNNPLDVPLVVGEKYEVSPTMAEDAQDSSIKASMWGAGLVAGFMLLYYGIGGIAAVISVLVNIVIVLGVLASIRATITLPGIAAMVLTIGMAVDANVLIFERIREELKSGKSIKTALIGGYEKAFSTIIDANVTTLITASILIWLGTGPVKGFGVTLAIGISASMFCSLIISRMILDFAVGTLGMKSILAMNLFKSSAIDFLSYRKVAFALSWIVVLIGIFGAYQKRDTIFGIEFTGGDEVTVIFDKKLSHADIATVAREHSLGEVTPIYQTDIGDGKEWLKIQTKPDFGIQAFEALNDAHPEANLELVAETKIGASVSDTIRKNAFISVAVALLGILFYVAVRFEFGFGIGAVVATVHDVLMTIGVYVMLGGQFTAPMIAAILTIVGYSINDTIVVFDRIREELLLNPTTNLRKIVNVAINSVLTRTILTSITTLLAAGTLWLFGAGVINDFALVFIIGIITGTFSSIFIASPVFYWWHKGDRRHVEEKEFLPNYEWSTDTSAARSK